MGKIDKIIIKGAKGHNLKNIDVEIPRDKLVVLTGLSGSGKSTLAFDTIYAEGQRKYVESLSAYARQFLGQMDKPDVEFIEGLSPAISIDQKTTSKNPRSTVGTVTEIYDYLRLLYARVGIPHCPVCGREISGQSVDQITDRILQMEDGTKLMLLAPVISGKKGEHEKIIERIRKDGFSRVRIDGEVINISEEEVKLEKTKKHTIEIVVDRIVIKPGIESRLSDSIELALSNGQGLIVASVIGGEDILFSTKFACPEHGEGIPEMEPRVFSFNAPFGACPDCNGIGYILRVDPELVVVDSSKSIAKGALGSVFSSMDESGYYYQMISALAEAYGEDLDTPFEELSEEFRNDLLFGSDKPLNYVFESRYGGTRTHLGRNFEGVVRNLERRYRETNSDFIKAKIEEYMSHIPCATCGGKRLKPEVLAVTVGGKNIYEFTEMSVSEAMEFVQNLELTEKERIISKEIIKEIKNRLNFMINVGLDYLTLSR
ncbi:MAG: excinuclease ABC subunit UvrA, partial [Firmicutes bacterium]|nr:excinuclease ABC subunit UvrA [Bacillota bacterium]